MSVNNIDLHGMSSAATGSCRDKRQWSGSDRGMRLWLDPTEAMSIIFVSWVYMLAVVLFGRLCKFPGNVTFVFVHSGVHITVLYDTLMAVSQARRSAKQALPPPPPRIYWPPSSPYLLVARSSGGMVAPFCQDLSRPDPMVGYNIYFFLLSTFFL